MLNSLDLKIYSFREGGEIKKNNLIIYAKKWKLFCF